MSEKQNCIVVQRGELVAVLPTLKAAAAPQPMLKALSHVLMDADGKHLILSSTDLTVQWTTRIPCQCDCAFRVAVPVAVLHDIITNWQTANTVSMAVEEEWQVRLTGDDGHEFVLRGMDPAEFPMGWEMRDPDATLIIQRKVLEQMATLCVPVTAKDEARPILTAVHVTLAGGKLQAAATDGFRLIEAKWEHETPKEISFIIPGNDLRRFAKQFEDDAITLTMEGERLMMRDSRHQLRSHPPTGMYPDFNAIINMRPQTWVEATVDRGELLKALKPLGKIERGATLTVRFDAETNVMHLTTRSAENGEGRGTVNADILTYAPKPKKGKKAAEDKEPEPLQYVMNLGFVEDALAHLPKEQVHMVLRQPVEPVTFHLVDDSEVDLLHIMMPMQIGR